MSQQIAHETLGRDDVKIGSNRSFGIVFAGVFSVLAAVLGWNGNPYAVPLLAIALVFGGLAFLAPNVLGPLNRLWFRFGLLLHLVINPLVMGMLFFLTVLPTGLIMRALGKDLLRLRRRADLQSYWISRTPPGPAPDSMRNQF